jgi:cytochrome c-type biogenesis protein CcmH
MRVKTRSWAPWAMLGVVAVTALVALAVRSQPSDSPAARAARLSRELACPVCDGQSVADSNAPEARQIRDDIPRRIEAGESDQQIRDAYVRAYGDRVLLTPDSSGIGFVAWALPAGVLVVGGAGIVLAIRRWSRTPRLTATADDEALVERERGRR